MPSRDARSRMSSDGTGERLDDSERYTVHVWHHVYEYFRALTDQSSNPATRAKREL
jgi:hypothetical protein